MSAARIGLLVVSVARARSADREDVIARNERALCIMVRAVFVF